MIPQNVREIAAELECEVPEFVKPSEVTEIIEWLIDVAIGKRCEELTEIEEKFERILDELNDAAASEEDSVLASGTDETNA